MQKNMWCTMLILIPIMLEDNIMWSRDEMFNSYHNVLNQHGELQHHGDQVTIVKSLCSVDWTTSIGWSPKLSMLSYHNYVWQLSALLQPCKADHHHGWGHRRWSSIYKRAAAEAVADAGAAGSCGRPSEAWGSQGRSCHCRTLLYLNIDPRDKNALTKHEVE